LKRRDLAAHADVCKHRPVVCEYKYLNFAACLDPMPYVDRLVHEKECMPAHINLLADAHEKSLAICKRLEEDNKELKVENKRLGEDNNGIEVENKEWFVKNVKLTADLDVQSRKRKEHPSDASECDKRRQLDHASRSPWDAYRDAYMLHISQESAAVTMARAAAASREKKKVDEANQRVKEKTERATAEKQRNEERARKRKTNEEEGLAAEKFLQDQKKEWQARQ
jgi:hypothetical protein